MSSDHNLKQWLGCDVATDVANRNGKYWEYAGTAVRTPTNYATSGSNPQRKRDVWSGSVGATWSRSSRDIVGVLPFGPQGWASIALPMVYIPNGTFQLQIQKPDRTAIVTLDVTGGNLQKGGVTQAPWAVGDRLTLQVIFGSTGSLKGVLYNLTQLNISQNTWSFDLGTWTPGAVGFIKVSGVLGASSQEIDGAAVCKWYTVPGVDSLSHTTVSGLTPAMAMVEHVAGALAPPTDASLVPDAAYQNRVYVPAGQARRVHLTVMGRSGQTQASFKSFVTDFLFVHGRGVEIDLMDFASINEFSGISDLASQTAVLDAMETRLGQLCDQARDADCRVRISTGPTRPVGATWTALQSGAGPLWDVRLRRLAAQKQSPKNHIIFSDPAAAIPDHSVLFTAGDDTHPNAAGDLEIAKQMILTQVIPAPAETVGRSITQATVSALLFIAGETTGRSLGECTVAIAGGGSASVTPTVRVTARRGPIVTGYDLDVEINLVEPDGETAPSIITDTVVQVAYLAIDRLSVLFGPYACSASYPGADWSIGKIRFRIPGADTAALTATRCLVEVRRLLPVVIGQPAAEEVPYLAGPFDIVRGRL